MTKRKSLGQIAYETTLPPEPNGCAQWRDLAPHIQALYNCSARAAAVAREVKRRGKGLDSFPIGVTYREMDLPTFHCLRCDHGWIPRKPKKPLICPKCKSAYWDRPRKVVPKAARSGVQPPKRA